MTSNPQVTTNFNKCVDKQNNLREKSTLITLITYVTFELYDWQTHIYTWPSSHTVWPYKLPSSILHRYTPLSILEIHPRQPLSADTTLHSTSPISVFLPPADPDADVGPAFGCNRSQRKRGSDVFTVGLEDRRGRVEYTHPWIDMRGGCVMEQTFCTESMSEKKIGWCG